MENTIFAPSEISFSKKTALWLIQNLQQLRSGLWPRDSSTHKDELSQHGKHKQAPFITSIDYAAEIQVRLEKCGIDGLILEAIEGWGKSEESIASYFNMPLWSIYKRKNKALRYIASGSARRWLNTDKRRGITYQEFKKKRSNK